jgi:hypothetical protein
VLRRPSDRRLFFNAFSFMAAMSLVAAVAALSVWTLSDVGIRRPLEAITRSEMAEGHAALAEGDAGD